MIRPFLAACLLALLPSRASGPERAAADAVDEVVATAMSADELPSVALVVGRAGVILKRASYGQASIELGVSATTKTVYPIASATKTFTSLAVQLLVREGAFSLEDSITELLPDLPETWLEVTPRHLLSHTSGLPDVVVQSGREALVGRTREEALGAVCARPLDFPAGTGWRYNQTNNLLLLMLVETYGERPFEDFVRARILAPLALEATRFGDADDVVPRREPLGRRPAGEQAGRWSPARLSRRSWIAAACLVLVPDCLSAARPIHQTSSETARMAADAAISDREQRRRPLAGRRDLAGRKALQMPPVAALEPRAGE